MWRRDEMRMPWEYFFKKKETECPGKNAHSFLDVQQSRAPVTWDMKLIQVKGSVWLVEKRMFSSANSASSTTCFQKELQVHRTETNFSLVSWPRPTMSICFELTGNEYLLLLGRITLFLVCYSMSGSGRVALLDM